MTKTDPTISQDALIERLRKRLEAEASRRNSAYDHYGMDNTPRSVDPDVFDLLAHFEAHLRNPTTDTEAMRHPTEAMLNAARDWSCAKYGKPIGNDAAIGCWQAMLDALAKGGAL